MVGNRLHKGYDSIRDNDYTLTECFKDHPVIRSNMNKLWENLTEVDTFFSKREPTDIECEIAAKVCENFCKIFPVIFPKRNLTRKMVEWSFVMPKFIREKKGLMNKILRLEQEGEHLHQMFNALERTLKPLVRKQERYFAMLKAYENKVYCTK